MIVLSIHLITYNNENHIEETLQSILKQNVDFEFEIVIGDDCSTDNTLAIIKSIAQVQPQIFKISQNNKRLGILQNYKTTLDRCNGTYVFDIAGDDVLKCDNALQKMVSLLQNNDDLGFVDSGYDRYLENTKAVKKFSNQLQMNLSHEAYRNEVLLGKVFPVGHCFKKKLLYKYVDFDTYLDMQLTIEDYPILVDMVMHTNFVTIKESLLMYRIHDNSHSNLKDLDHKLSQTYQMKMLFDYFSNKYNFSKQIISSYENIHNKELLFLASYFQSKAIGKETFSKISSKNLNDYIHYYASQYSLVSKTISLRKKLLRFL